MARAIWKGAISFGLVHIPVSLKTATSSQRVDFDWLDKRTMDPVGYKKINKTTGKNIANEHIVKGVQYQKDQYVILSEEEIKGAHPEATQTIDLFAFLDSSEIPLINFHKPYFLSPEKRGEKVYALLRETLIKTGKVALANVVVRTRQYLAVVMPVDAALVMMQLRWPAEMRSVASLDLPQGAVKPKLSAQEKNMAERLVNDMTTTWQPEEYVNTFNDTIMQLVEQKAEAGKVETVDATTERDTTQRSADVIDLTELLKRSLKEKPAKSSAGSKAKSTSSKRKSPAAKTSTSGSRRRKATEDSSPDKTSGKNDTAGKSRKRA